MANIKPTFKWVVVDATHFVDTRGCDTVADWLSVYGETVVQTQLGTTDFPMKTINAAILLLNTNNVTGVVTMALNGVFKENITNTPNMSILYVGNGLAYINFDGSNQMVYSNNNRFRNLSIDFSGLPFISTDTPSKRFRYCVIKNAISTRNLSYTYSDNNMFIDCDFTHSPIYTTNGSYTADPNFRGMRSIFLRCQGRIAHQHTVQLRECIFVECNLDWLDTTMATKDIHGTFFYNCFYADGITPFDSLEHFKSITKSAILSENPLVGELGTLNADIPELLTADIVNSPISWKGGGSFISTQSMAENTTNLVNIFLDGTTLKVHQWEKIAQGGSATTIVLASDASIVNDYYNGRTVEILSGSGAGEIRQITGYVGATRTATLSTALDVAADNTSMYCISGFYSKRLDIRNLVTAKRLTVECETVKKLNVKMSKGSGDLADINILNGSELKVLSETGEGNFDVAIADFENMVEVPNVRFLEVSFEVETPML